MMVARRPRKQTPTVSPRLASCKRGLLLGEAVWGNEMSATNGSVTNTAVRKLEPRTKMPSAVELEGLSSEDMEVLERRLSETAECVYNPCFREPDAENTLLGPLPGNSERGGAEDSGADLLLGGTGKALTTEQEQRIFLRLNYCRYRVMNILRKHRGKRLPADETRELIRWERLVTRTRCDIVRCNVALVMAMGRRTRLTGVDYSDLVSEGNLALLRSVDKFDCARGFKFSTYACRAILKSFSRVATRTARYRGYFPTEFDPALEKSQHIQNRRNSVEDECVDELKSILGENTARLSEVEQCVIRARFAISEELAGDGLAKGKTLEQVGEMIGVTKERVRQIQNKALGKLREVLEQDLLTA